MPAYEYPSPRETYLAYCKMSTNAAELYHKVLFHGALGMCLGYDAVHMIQPGAIFHNVFIGLVGVSTLARKTTTIGLLTNTLPENMRIPQMITGPEKLLEILSKKSDRYWECGELSNILKPMTSNGIMARMAGVLNDLHGCPREWTYELRQKKSEDYEFAAKKVYISLISSTTPEVLDEIVNREIAQGGFLYRNILVPGTAEYKAREKLPDEVLKWCDASKVFFQNVYDIRSPIQFELSDKALETFNKIDKASMEKYSNNPFVGRYMNYLISFADTSLLNECVRIGRSKGIFLAEYRDVAQFLYDIEAIPPFGDVIKVETFYRGSEEENRSTTIYTNDTNKGKESKSSPLPDLPSSESLTISMDTLLEAPRTRIAVPESAVLDAWSIIEPCLEFAITTVDGILLDAKLKKLRTYLMRQTDWIPRNVCLRNTNLYAKEFDVSRETLVQRGEVEAISKPYTRKNGSRDTVELLHWIPIEKRSRIIIPKDFGKMQEDRQNWDSGNITGDGDES